MNQDSFKMASAKSPQYARPRIRISENDKDSYMLDEGTSIAYKYREALNYCYFVCCNRKIE